MKKIIFLAFLLGMLLVPLNHASAINVFPQCAGDTTSTVCSATTDRLFGAGSVWNRILETFTFIIGAVSVLMIIIGGIRYVTSNGDATQLTAAKNTVLYAVVGLVVAIMAYSIVHFVITNIA